MTARGWAAGLGVASLILYGLAFAYLLGIHAAQSTTYAEIMSHVATVDTVHVVPEPMHVGSTLGLHCYIERRDPSTTTED